MRNVKLLFAIALLLCILPMPYGYYTLIRWLSTFILGWLAYDYSQKDKKELCVICISLALLFQPFIKIPLGRVLWNVMDVITAIFMLLAYWSDKKEEICLTWYDISGAGTLICLDCGMKEEVDGFIHSNYSCSIGRQCQHCGAFFTEHNESEQYHTFGSRKANVVCPKCGETYAAKDERVLEVKRRPLFCPKCKSKRLRYDMKYIT